MDFSVLMSVYWKERPKNLRNSIASIFNQSLPPSELVLVKDGCLGDELESILLEFEHFNIRYVELDENKGLGEALRLGLLECKYDYVARMDSDDICAYERFEKQINYLLENPDVDVLGTQMSEFIDEIGDINSIRRVPLELNDIIKMAKRRNPMNHISVMFKKSSVLKSGNYLPLPFLEDYYLWVRMIVSNMILANLDDVLVHARVGQGMYKRRGNKEQVKGFKVIMDLLYQNRLITRLNKFVTIQKLRVFLLIPSGLKKIIYSRILRGKK